MNVELENLDLENAETVNFADFEADPKVPSGEFQDFAALDANTFNDEDNTIKVKYTNGNKVLRYSYLREEFFYLQLSLKKGHVDLGRLNKGASVVDSHWTYSIKNILGAVVPGSATETEATLQFSKREEIKPLIDDIRAGIIRNVSPGLHIHETKDITKEGDSRRTLLVTKWEPHEISFCASPADPEAQALALTEKIKDQKLSLGSKQAKNPKEQIKMETKEETNTTASAEPAKTVELSAVKAEAEAKAKKEAMSDSKEILSIAEKAGLGIKFANEMMEAGKSVEEVQKEAFNLLADKTKDQDVSNIQVLSDEKDNAIEGAQLALEARVGLSERQNGNKFNGMSMMEMAKFFVEQAGKNIGDMSKSQIAEFSLHSTSDFPNLLANVASKRLQNSYKESNARKYTEFCSQENLVDFKPTNIIKVSGAKTPELVTEGGEFKQSTVSDGKETYQLATYGEIISISRQTIINDDLRALNKIPKALGQAAARKEQALILEILTSNPTMGDGTALFHADHGNLSNALLKSNHASAAFWKDFVNLFRKQKGLLDTDDYIEVYPDFVICGPDQEHAARQLFQQSIVANETDKSNPYVGSSKHIVFPQLTGDTYYGICNPNDCEGIVYGYLEGAEGPQITTRNGWEVDGVEVKMVLDFAAKAVDHRALARSTNDAS